MVKYKTLNELQVIAQDFTQKLAGGQVYGLNGELGAGKTTFVQFVAQSLGIQEIVNSPTYTYLKVYNIPGSDNILVHVDAYRIKSGFDVDSIGLADYLVDDKAIIFVEWAENIRDLLPEKAKYLNFKILSEKREIEGEI